VLNHHEEEPVKQTLNALNRQWESLDELPESAAAVVRWRATEPALAGAERLSDVLAARTDPDRTEPVMAALARLGLVDELAARTLLQAVLGGLVLMAARARRFDRFALEELVSLAWERIRSYPVERRGSVAANVIFDVRKAYVRHRRIEDPGRDPWSPSRHPARSCEPSAEEVVVAHQAAEAVADASRRGVISEAAAQIIIRTRLLDHSLAEVAAAHGTTPANACCARWRAERKLRPTLAEAC
jgi:hypothetical protein